MIRLIAMGLLLGLTGLSLPALAQDTSAAGGTILVFDASGSMWGQIDGVPKITIARDVVKELLDDLPPERRLGLVAYGHRRKGDCKDIQTLVPVGGDRAAIAKAIAGMNPVGKTPMTAAVQQAAEALKFTENEATVILVSDGQETCNADPCAAAEKLATMGIGLTVHTVGFGLGEEEAGAKGELKCMADATGGRFFVADDAKELKDALAQISVAPSTKSKTAEPALAKADPAPAPEPAAIPTGKASLEATDQQGGPVIRQDLVWTVRHGATGEVLHESDATGKLEVELPRGVHDVSVVRGSDGATAEGEIKLTGDRASLSLPIVVELKATLKVPATAAAGSKVRVIWTGPGEGNDYISVGPADAGNSKHANYTRTKDGNPLQLLMPPTAGTYEVRYVSAKNHDVLTRESIDVTEVGANVEVPAKAPAGSTLRVAWTGPDYANDYISVAKVGSAGRSEVNYTRTSAGNPLKLLMPAEPGPYEVRYVQSQSHKILASQPIETTKVSATLDAPDSGVAGTRIKVSWTGPDYANDYVSIAKVGSAGRSEVGYQRTSRGSPLELTLPDDPGTYELRYVQSQTHRILASKPVTVTAAQ